MVQQDLDRVRVRLRLRVRVRVRARARVRARRCGWSGRVGLHLCDGIDVLIRGDVDGCAAVLVGQMDEHLPVNVMLVTVNFINLMVTVSG